MEKRGLFTAFAEKLRKNKRLEIAVYASMLALAAVIFLLTGGISSGRGTKGASQRAETAEAVSSGTELERRLEEILSSISGAGRVKVMVTTLAGDEETVCDPGTLKSGAQKEARGSELSRIVGVIIVAQGAGDIRVKNELQAAVMTVLGTDAASISIFSMNE